MSKYILLKKGQNHFPKLLKYQFMSGTILLLHDAMVTSFLFTQSQYTKLNNYKEKRKV